MKFLIYNPKGKVNTNLFRANTLGMFNNVNLPVEFMPLQRPFHRNLSFFRKMGEIGPLCTCTFVIFSNCKMVLQV